MTTEWPDLELYAEIFPHDLFMFNFIANLITVVY
jgi:hypothetical protein